MFLHVDGNSLVPCKGELPSFAHLIFAQLNRGALSFHPAMPAFVLANKKKERNRWIKSFNYPCKWKAATACVLGNVCMCVFDTNFPSLHRGREVVATVTATGAWRKRDGQAEGMNE